MNDRDFLLRCRTVNPTVLVRPFLNLFGSLQMKKRKAQHQFTTVSLLLCLLVLCCLQGGSASQKEPPFTKDSRIAIVGAGKLASIPRTICWCIHIFCSFSLFPFHNKYDNTYVGVSGIDMASQLRKRGYPHVTLLEQTNRIGGKAYTLYRDLNTGEECTQMITGNSVNTDQCISYEMGPVFVLGHFKEIINLIHEYDLTAPVLSEGIIAFGEGPNFDSIGIGTFILGSAQSEVDAGRVKVPWYVPNGVASLWAVFDAVNRYSKLHREIFGVFSYSMPPRLTKEEFQQINMSYEEFLRQNNLHSMVDFAKLLYSGVGYGYINSIPAFYGLWMITPQLLHLAMQGTIRFQIGASPSNVVCVQFVKLLTDLLVGNNAGVSNGFLFLQPEGWQKLLTTIADKEELNIQLGVTDLQVDRSLDDDRAPIRISYNQVLTGFPDGVPGSQPNFVEEEYDFVIYTAPHAHAHKYVVDLTEQETKIFDKLESLVVMATLYTATAVRGYYTDGGIAYHPNRLNSLEDDGRWATDVNAGNVFSIPPFHQLRVGYQFVTDFCTYDSVLCDEDRYPDPFYAVESTKARDQLTEDLELQCDDVNLKAQFPWPYFPHFNNEALEEGFLWDLLDMQGEQKTWWIGASASLDTTHNVINYNRMILDEKL
jgi:Flavin containing amine oxidoreductase